MEFGIHIGTRGCMVTRENMMALATAAETNGYGVLGVADHLIVPVKTDVRYPYTADGIWPGAPTGPQVERDPRSRILQSRNESEHEPRQQRQGERESQCPHIE